MEHKASKRQTVCALACALVFLAAAFVCVTAEESEAAATDYTIGMREGDTFSYTPATNLDSASGSTVTISISGTAVSGTNAFLTIDSGTSAKVGGTITGTPQTAGEYTLKVTATWISEYNSDVSQEIDQTITIVVLERVAVSSNSGSIVYVLGSDSGALSYSIEDLVTVPDDTTVTYSAVLTSTTAAAYSGWLGTEGSEISTSASVSGTPGTAQTTSGTYDDAGTYVVDWTVTATSATYDNGEVTSTANYKLTIYVTGDIAATGTTSATYVGQTWTYTATSNASDLGISAVEWAIDSVTVGGSEVTLSSTTSGDVITYSLGNGQTITLDASSGLVTFTPLAVSASVDQYKITLKVSAVYEGVTVSNTADIDLYVYAELAYSTTPTASVTLTEASGTMITIEVGTSGATTVTIDWGDGTTETFTTTTSVTIEDLLEGTSHVYATEGIYTVSVTASNDAGDVVYDILYVTSAVFPTISVTVESGEDPHDVTVYFTIEFAETVSIDWNDGTVETFTANTDPTITELAGGYGHTYADDGDYTITIVALNSDGSRITTIEYKTDASSGSLLSEYSLVLILLVLALAFAIIGYFRHPYAYIAALILVIAIVVCIATGCTGLADVGVNL